VPAGQSQYLTTEDNFP